MKMGLRREGAGGWGELNYCVEGYENEVKVITFLCHILASGDTNSFCVFAYVLLNLLAY